MSALTQVAELLHLIVIMTNTNTYKAIGVALGTGLAILWVAGLSSPYAPGWFTWLDGLAALGAFFIAGRVSDQDLRSRRMGGPITLSIGLFALWIAGLATDATPWLCWWTFAFACAALVFGVSAGGTKPIAQAPESKSRRPKNTKPEKTSSSGRPAKWTLGTLGDKDAWANLLLRSFPKDGNRSAKNSKAELAQGAPQE